VDINLEAYDIAAGHYDIPFSKRTTVSVDTLLDWAARYRSGGFEAPLPNRVRTAASPVRSHPNWPRSWNG
jgi:hypothetical protein